MTIATKENLHELFLSKDRQRAHIRLRKTLFEVRTVSKKEFSGIPEDGWELDPVELKHSIRLRKPKPHLQQFQDNVWLVLSRMGFNYVNADQSCTLQLGKNVAESQQFDVVAIDDEVAVLVVCKSSDTPVPKRGDLKHTIEALQQTREQLMRTIRKLFDKPQMKVAIILATRNYQVSQPDMDRLNAAEIRHFGDAEMEYYSELVNQIGTASRYQFEADLFPNQSIPEMPEQIPAIRAKMGGLEYYSFCIEPERLLKLGFVLHRSRSIRLLPTYQRLIKKSRLASVRRFIADGGYFPNSLIINIEAGKKGLKFDQSELRVQNSSSAVGILYLPTKFRSAYIIDGQHRLYGYSDSGYETKDAIPVVAFVNLERSAQLRLFMEINENQKAVSTNLRITLGADLNYDSESLKERADGLIKTVAQQLGEDVSSPLYGLVLLGEDKRTETKIITLDAIVQGLRTANFVGSFTKDQVKKPGVFYSGSNDISLKEITQFLYSVFDYLREEAPTEWERIHSEGGIILTSDGIRALISLTGDITEHLANSKEILPSGNKKNTMMDAFSPFLIEIANYLEAIPEEIRHDIRTRTGTGAPTRLRRVLQKELKDIYPEFDPPGLEEYWRDQSNQFNAEAFSLVRNIENFLNTEVKSILENEYGVVWNKKGLPLKLFQEIQKLAGDKNYENEDPDQEVEPWDCLYLINYRDIFGHKAQWSRVFGVRFTIPGQEQLKKDEKTKWLAKLNGIRNDLAHDTSITEADAAFVNGIHQWLLHENPNVIREYFEHEQMQAVS